ncbi:hypothetical protein QL285_060039 [Trifolium repens]|nr:hypothetical protein QL285_060039 [Trifolium repens]
MRCLISSSSMEPSSVLVEPSLKASYQGGRIKSLKYSTENPILLNVGHRNPINTQVPMTNPPLRADVSVAGCTLRHFTQPFWPSPP